MPLIHRGHDAACWQRTSRLRIALQPTGRTMSTLLISQDHCPHMRNAHISGSAPLESIYGPLAATDVDPVALAIDEKIIRIRAALHRSQIGCIRFTPHAEPCRMSIHHPETILAFIQCHRKIVFQLPCRPKRHLLVRRAFNKSDFVSIRNVDENILRARLELEAFRMSL